ncbi:M23 family metallopeptidase [Acetivibrio cellulolyticus]|uniref:M23 family metallopeptidase n=1 Tax=Acetivibrio cellulolyticus TaxID=35830 RepID=UPI0001E2CC2A|nr:M23 family metallopeptidase [Acetivibrio cellulolyticus]
MNFKKLFPEKKASQKRVLDFFDKKGFYIVLTLCIAIVGVTAALITTKNISSSGNFKKGEIITNEMANSITSEDESSISSASIRSDLESSGKTATDAPKAISKATPAKQDSKATSEPKKTNAGKDPKKTSEPSKGSNSTKKASTDSLEVETSNKAESKSFSMPVFGDISLEYAQDKLVYSKTLDEWRSHAGLDLKAARGSAVKVAADGVVSEIKNDPRLGVTIIIDHSNGLKTVYANLASGDMVSPNQKVKQGEVIGAVGNSASFESAEPAHLHFEVLKNNKNVNPSDYLPNKAS